MAAKIKRKAPGARASRRHPPSVQVAALCWRRTKKGHKILLITSRDTGRWVIPKGWPMRNRTEAEAAAREAYEEAGISGRIDDRPIGFYSYFKRLDGNRFIPCIVRIYPLEVRRMQRDYPERGQRRNRWFRPKKAARRVLEPDLARILKKFAPAAPE